MSEPLLFVLSGPSGVGKDAVVSRLKEKEPDLFFIVTSTTRPPRPGEVEDKDYHFVNEPRFKEMQARGELLEWAQVYGHWYGVPRAPVERALDGGKDIFIKTDVQGAATIKRLVPHAILIFLTAPSQDELARRLGQRRSESMEQLETRMAAATREQESLPLFDYLVVNQDLRVAVSQIQAIITAERCRVVGRRAELG